MSTNIRQKVIQKTLDSFNLSKNEKEVFFALLGSKKGSVSQVAKDVRSIPRTSVYDILKRLQQKGFVGEFLQENKRFFYIENAESIIDNLEEDKREIAKKQDALRNVSDIMKQMQRGSAYAPSIRFFEDKKGISVILREIQDARKELRTIANLAGLINIFPEVKERDDLMDFQTYHILRKDLMVKNRAGEHYLNVAPIGKHHHAKWLPKGMDIQTDTLIWEGHVAILDYSGNLTSVIIDNPTIHDTFIVWFEMMWRSIKEEIKPLS